MGGKKIAHTPRLLHDLKPLWRVVYRNRGVTAKGKGSCCGVTAYLQF